MASMKVRKTPIDMRCVDTIAKYLFYTFVIDFTLEMLDLIHRTYEADESFFVNLSGATNATIGSGQAQGTILNDDLAPSVTISDVATSELNSGAANAGFRVTLSASSGLPVTISYATANGSAAAGSDYTGTSGTLTIPAGATTGYINVPILGGKGSPPSCIARVY